MSYALVTGASKGIGRAIAEELAARKVDLLLVARSSDALQQLAQELGIRYSVKTAWLAADLSSADAPEKIGAWISRENYPVHILVNNAGYGLSGPFDKYTAKDYADMLRVNVQAPMELTALLLPLLKQQPQAYLLNIVSSAAYQAVPGLAAYSASKAFMLNFTRGLRFELRNTNISVTAVSPGATDTGFANRAQIVNEKAVKAAERFNMTPRKVARLSVDAMYARKAEVITGFVNKLAAFFVWLLPKSVSEKTAAGLYGLD
ncbi:SDR family NAD(P)-dependent oxidoreductase [Sediminibacterium soli]|uniref:SDR family NAD(P)-dependent oxidoreductase n=1 Tax=Sediminibacterium soli TaxID=2698829 RepID=UPI00137A938B|nr:SDR family NAD(P)-dependent oxidoreductase [Sediminibacterium soli]NCI46410.1 SDR family NAD(P)-dependent oxidoreductase [Sediminibacterium soli]